MGDKKIHWEEKNVVVISTSKQLLAIDLLKSPTHGESHHLQGALLNDVMDKFMALTLPNCGNFVPRLKRFNVNWNRYHG